MAWQEVELGYLAEPMGVEFSLELIDALHRGECARLALALALAMLSD